MSGFSSNTCSYSWLLADIGTNVHASTPNVHFQTAFTACTHACQHKQVKGGGPAIPNIPGIIVTCESGREDRTADEVAAVIEEVSVERERWGLGRTANGAQEGADNRGSSIRVLAKVHGQSSLDFGAVLCALNCECVCGGGALGRATACVI